MKGLSILARLSGSKQELVKHACPVNMENSGPESWSEWSYRKHMQWIACAYLFISLMVDMGNENLKKNDGSQLKSCCSCKEKIPTAAKTCRK